MMELSMEARDPHPVPPSSNEKTPSLNVIGGQVENMDFYLTWQQWSSELLFPLSKQCQIKPAKERFKEDPDFHNIIPQISWFRLNIIHHTKNQENLSLNLKKGQSVDSNIKMTNV